MLTRRIKQIPEELSFPERIPITTADKKKDDQMIQTRNVAGVTGRQNYQYVPIVAGKEYNDSNMSN